MAKRKKQLPAAPISKSELEILKVLWSHGSGTVRELNRVLGEQGIDWAYTTVLTLLQRMEAKGYVSSEKGQTAYVFRAALSREKLLRLRLWELADEFAGGTATPLVQALVDGHRFTAEEIESFRRLLDEMAQQGKGARKQKTTRPRKRRSGDD